MVPICVKHHRQLVGSKHYGSIASGNCSRLYAIAMSIIFPLLVGIVLPALIAEKQNGIFPGPYFCVLNSISFFQVVTLLTEFIFNTNCYCNALWTLYSSLPTP
ncbi:hypothetical protein C1646_701761 [Rhizophagus diaphanus]|nr:hypothetical protein C1646_701761 [Rhizophagus diaphanus] [Rhizophagus sp. MUCL 43196]